MLPGEGKPFSFNIVGASFGKPPTEKCPQEGTRRGAVLFPGIMGLAFAWETGGAWISQWFWPPSLSEEAEAPGPALVCILHRNLCGCFSKKH